MATDQMQDLLRALSPEACADALAGPAPWRHLAEQYDQLLMSLALPVLGPGKALVALGAYGRSELTRWSEIELLILAPANAEDVVRAVVAPLWDQQIRTAHRIHVANRLSDRSTNAADVLPLLDARFICGDPATFVTFDSARRVLVARMQRALSDELARRQRERIAMEPWQRAEPDLVRGRGGLDAYVDAHHAETIEALVEDLHPPAIGDPTRPLTEPANVLLRALCAVHAQRGDRSDVLSSVNVAALGGIDGRQVLLAMRAIDRALVDRPAEQPGRGASLLRGLRRLMGGGGDTPTVVESDHSLLTAALRDVPAFDPLPTSPWLQRLLPEWEGVRGMIRANSTHAHPVDTHLMRTVHELRRGSAEWEADAALLIEGVPDLDELLLAGLLHDIGIDANNEEEHAGVAAVIAERVTARAGLSADAARRIVSTVQHHQLLSMVAARRDIADENVIAEVATILGDEDVLDMVYLLTLADAAASGADVDSWRIAQIRTLFARVLHTMTMGGSRPLSEVQREAALAALSARFQTEQIEAHLNALPARYLLAMSPSTIADHLEMIANLDSGVAARHDSAGDVHRITIATADRPGILSDVAGAVAAQGLNILGGTVFTRDDGIAIDVLHVAPPGGSTTVAWDTVCAGVVSAVQEHVDFGTRLAALHGDLDATDTRTALGAAVTVNNSESEEFSILEVRTRDRRGLLYAITHALSDSGLDIHLAKVDTVAGEAFDAFYIRRANGRRVEAPDEIERLTRNVREALAALDAA